MPSLWSPTDWPHRLAELQASTGELKEAPLRRDVRSLGMLLGEVLREQAGVALYEAVEALRRGAIARREAEAGQSNASNASAGVHLQQALDRVHSFELPAAYQLARAFSFYFELINLAETNHRKRRRLSHQLEENGSSTAGVQRGDLRGTLRRMREAGFSAEDASPSLVASALPVFTAHPTEVARRSVMFKRRRISDLLERLDRIPVPESQLKALEHDLLAEITALWQTDDVRSARPTVRDEIRMALDYYEASLFDTLPVLYAEVASALAAEYPQKQLFGYKSSATCPSSFVSARGSAATATAIHSSLRRPPAMPSRMAHVSCSRTTAAVCRTSSSSSQAPPSRFPSPRSSPHCWTAISGSFAPPARPPSKSASPTNPSVCSSRAS